MDRKRGGTGHNERTNRGAPERRCSWTEDDARCPTSHYGPPGLIFEAADGRAWCVFHRPEEAADELGLSDSELEQALHGIVLRQALENRRVAIPGFRVPCGLDFTTTVLLGREAPAGWATDLDGVDLRGCVVAGDLAVSGLGSATSIDLRDAEILGNVSIGTSGDVAYGPIDLDRASIAADLAIGATDATRWRDVSDRAVVPPAEPARVRIRRISVNGLKGAERIAINSVEVEGHLDAAGAKVRRLLQISDCVLGSKVRPRDLADEQLAALLSNVLVLGDPMDERDPTRIGALLVSDSEVVGSLLLRPAAVSNLQLSRTTVHGLIETSGLPLPANAMVLDSSIGAGFELLRGAAGTSAAAPTAREQHALALFKRSFRVLRATAHDVEQRSGLLRAERAAVSRLARVDGVTRALWSVHEFFTSCGEDWRYPIEVLVCNALLFTSLLTFFDRNLGLPKAIAISATNTIAPFLALQSIVDENSLSAVMLSVVQSAFSAALLSSIVISLRAKITD